MKYQDFLKAKQSHVKPVGFDVDADAGKRNEMKNKNKTKRVNELETALREALSGIDEFMTRTIYRVHGEDIERWRKVLEGEKDETK